MQEVAQLSDATVDEVRESAERFAEYRDAMHPYKRVLDLWVSRHFGNERAEYLLGQFGTQVLDVFRGQADPADETQRETLEEAAALDDAKSFFHWELEFPEVYYDLDRTTKKQNPGFDAVIGNPPYVRIQTLSEKDEQAVEYFNDVYEAPSGNYDIYALFAEKGGTLIHEDGTLGYILPHKFFTANYGEGLRTRISDRQDLRRVVDFGSEQVFEHATTYTCLLFLDGSPRSEFTYVEPPFPEAITTEDDLQTFTIQTDALDEKPWSFGNPKLLELRARLDEAHPSLEDTTSRIFQGLKTSADDVYIVEERHRDEERVRVYSPELDEEVWVEPHLFHPLIKGGDVEAYHIDDTERLILFPYGPDENGEMDLIPTEELEQAYPLTWEYLEKNREVLEGRENGRMEIPGWYGYVYPKALDVIERPKIFTPDFADVASYAYDESGKHYFTGGAAGGYGILVEQGLSSWYALAILNSRLLDHILKTVSSTFRGGWYSYESRFIKHLPIREIEFTTPDAERERHVEALIRDYEEARRSAPPPTDTAVLDAVEEHLSADPEQSGVVHDLLAHLAREMTQLKEERQDLERAFDPFKYLPRGASATPFSTAFSDEIKYAELAQSPVDVTEAQHSIDDARLVEADGTWVLEVRLKKRQPETWTEWQKEDGTIVREWAPVLRFRDLDAEKARFYRFALPRLDAFSADAFSGTIFPGGYTRTVKARLWATPVPVYDASVDLDALVDLERQIQETEQNIAFTDTLIDQIVYRLYGLSEEKVAVVEE